MIKESQTMEAKMMWKLTLATSKVVVEIERIGTRYKVVAPRPLSAQQLRELGHALLRVWAEERRP